MGLLDDIIYFFSMDRHILRRLDSEPNLISPYLDHDDRDIIIDHDAFIFFSGKY